ncbi:MAG: hypothetical protein IJ285_02525 [Clostridia bacterium]|nr:hypothetical protein [Clostridia bacterium]
MKRNKFLNLGLTIALLSIFCLFALGSGESSTSEQESEATEAATEIVYETANLQTMIDTLQENAMKAETLYQNKYIEVQGKIANFDSDGSYISIKPVGASEWDLTTTMCYIKNNTQKEFLMEKNVGDVITIKGKVKSIGEVMGYSINIDEVF